MEFKAFLQAISAASAPTDSRLYALVDHAGAPGLLKRLREQPQTRWTSLFSGSTEETAIEAAPLLLDLNTINREAWLRWLHLAPGTWHAAKAPA